MNARGVSYNPNYFNNLRQQGFTTDHAGGALPGAPVQRSALAQRFAPSVLHEEMLGGGGQPQNAFMERMAREGRTQDPYSGVDLQLIGSRNPYSMFNSSPEDIQAAMQQAQQGGDVFASNWLKGLLLRRQMGGMG